MDRLHRLGADREGVLKPGRVLRSRTPCSRLLDREELHHERPSAVQREGLTRSSSTRASDRARRLFCNKPENALKMTIKGPAGDERGLFVDAFNEVFGA
jgi:hypothetical protein